MQVNIFVTRIEGEPQTTLLVLPMSPKAPIPPQYRVGWNYYATVETRDRMFGDTDAESIEREISASGFALIEPTLAHRH